MLLLISDIGVGVVVRAFASQWADLGFVTRVESYQKTLKDGTHSFVLSTKGLVWRTSWQARLLCPWARHLAVCPQSLCGRQVAGPSSPLTVVAQSN